MINTKARRALATKKLRW